MKRLFKTVLAAIVILAAVLLICSRLQDRELLSDNAEIQQPLDPEVQKDAEQRRQLEDQLRSRPAVQIGAVTTVLTKPRRDAVTFNNESASRVYKIQYCRKLAGFKFWPHIGIENVHRVQGGVEDTADIGNKETDSLTVPFGPKLAGSSRRSRMVSCSSAAKGRTVVTSPITIVSTSPACP